MQFVSHMTELRRDGTDLLQLSLENSCQVQYISEQMHAILHVLHIETNTNFKFFWSLTFAHVLKTTLAQAL